MTEFENFKNSYITVVQLGLTARSGYDEAKRGNEVLHKFCENFIDNSNCSNPEKTTMKHELEIIKEALSKEIESFYQKG